MIHRKRIRWLCGCCALSVLMMSAWAKSHSDPASFISTTRERITLTIYDQDFALVSEHRPLSLQTGLNEVMLLSISPHLDAQSLLLLWDKASALRPEVLASTYDLGIQNKATLLQRYIGKTVQVIRYGQDGKPATVLQGILLSADETGLVLQGVEASYMGSARPDMEGIHVNPEGTLLLPKEAGISVLPALRLQLQAPAVGDAILQLGYLTSGLDWDADYIATLQRGDTMRLECWATVTNQTGLAFPNATVSLVAGAPSPFRAQTMVEYGREINLMFGAPPAPGGAPPRVVPQPLGELYSYPIRAPVSIADSQQSRLMLHEALQVPVKRRYTYRAPTLGAAGVAFVGKEPFRGSVEVALIFENRKEHGLGLPLPQGSVRIYEIDRAGVPRYLGAADLPATPANRKVTLSFGRTFDLVGEWQPLRQTTPRRGTARYEVQITFSNSKDQPVEVQVIQPFNGSWRILEASQPHERLSATAAQWWVKVPAGGTTRLRFTAEVRAL
jgi:hypothetical protein